MNIEIIDNFLDENHFKKLNDLFFKEIDKNQVKILCLECYIN